jgi:tetratricopeptide (TPR) repeat protein
MEWSAKMARHRNALRGQQPMRSIIAAVVTIALLLVAASDAAYVINKQNKRVEGTDIRAKSDGSIILQTSQGSRTFYKGQYLRAVADKPADFDKAQKLGAAGKFDEAVAILEKVVQNYRFLEWDNQARKALPLMYAGKGDHAKAAAAYEELFKAMPKGDLTPDLEWSYRECLLNASKYRKLEPILNKAIEEGSREDAARAQIMRGDLRRAEGQLEPAALDYLRTVVLFKGEKAHQPEANFKAAEVLEELRDRRAKDLYRTVVEDYPGSPYAAEAKKKL